LNRAVALRLAACGIMGLGAALLIAALLLSTYTKGKIAKIPLNLDATLVANGTGTAFDPESLNTERFVINRNVPVALQEQISVESPSNADVVTLQVGSSLRRTDKQRDSGLLLALVDTVTVNRWVTGKQCPTAFYVRLLLALLPATATLIGVMVLAQIPSGQDMIGVLLVMSGVAIHKPTAPEAPIQEVASTAP